MAVSCFLTREKAIKYFKEQGFLYSASAINLVISKDGKTLGWYYSYLGTYALSTKIGRHQMLSQPLGGYRTLTGGQAFLYREKLHRYASIKISSGSRPSVSLIIRSYTEILESEAVRELGVCDKPYACYGVFDSSSNKMLTCIWAAGSADKPVHYHPIFQNQDFHLDLKRQYLHKFKINDEFRFEKRYWLVNTHHGFPCLCELDMDLRRRLASLRNISYSEVIPEY